MHNKSKTCPFRMNFTLLLSNWIWFGWLLSSLFHWFVRTRKTITDQTNKQSCDCFCFCYIACFICGQTKSFHELVLVRSIKSLMIHEYSWNTLLNSLIFLKCLKVYNYSAYNCSPISMTVLSDSRKLFGMLGKHPKVPCLFWFAHFCKIFITPKA